ncbi:transglycosylase domain-containing protein [Thermoflavimicrobium dichotomicum]|uniref:Penicillin-binding protein 2A n=1 Tax=Thermoflavimicrobium dichotomicum TaxID=46223 RepID=A0A1I3RLR7_9BACL|nr:transglycosylase domain-containing protein [Thermoflavimicrobium dichotomicum]SFJ46251.1 penicillin-binding protein 2A [Thermoflavimicrobium dichotomicum]
MKGRKKDPFEFAPKVRSERVGKDANQVQKNEGKGFFDALRQNLAQRRREKEPSKKPPSIPPHKQLKVPKNIWLRLFNWRWLALVLVTSGLLMFGMVLTIMLSAEFVPLEKMDQQDPATIIYDKDNKEYTRLKKKRNELISIAELRKHNRMLVEAFKKVEDVRFEQHDGVDYYALARAVMKTIFTDHQQGGGTITMQVARNVVLESFDQTISRKLAEIAVAWNLERKYTKDQILEAYLNHISFGNEIYGVQLAAKVYFNKDLKKDTLTPGEVAVLVGLPKSPNGYNPYRTKKDNTGKTGLERLDDRQYIVLGEMAEENEMPRLISEAERDKWRNIPIQVQPKYHMDTVLRKYMSTPFDGIIHEELKEKFPQFEYEKLQTSGLKIYTNIDPKVQQAVEKALKDDRLFVSYTGQPMPANEVEAGVTVINPKDGSIVAIGGGRNYKPKITRNRAFDKHQPGSTIKPLTVYAPAIQEKGLDENTLLIDQKVTVNGKTVHNFDQKYYGKISMGEALKKSLNASTIWLLDHYVGIDKAFDYGRKLGLPLIDPDDKNPAPLALGGLTEGVSTVDMAQAYSVFVNQGEYYEAHLIREVRGKRPGEKQEISVKAEYKPIKVFDKQTAWYMLRMLRNNIMAPDGTSSARLPDGREVAGKTGTNQNKEKGWFVGFTPQLVTAVAVFNETPSDDKQKDKEYEITGAGAPAQIFRSIMWESLQDTPPQRFVRPPGVTDPAILLKDLNLKAVYQGGKVRLSWTGTGEGVTYQIARSEDGKSYEEIAKDLTTTNYIDPVGEPGLLDQALALFGKDKVYYYKVTVVDQNNPKNQKSATVKVTVSN